MAARFVNQRTQLYIDMIRQHLNSSFDFRIQEMKRDEDANRGDSLVASLAQVKQASQGLNIAPDDHETKSYIELKQRVLDDTVAIRSLQNRAGIESQFDVVNASWGQDENVALLQLTEDDAKIAGRGGKYFMWSGG